MEQLVVNPDFAQNEALRLEMLQMMDEVLMRTSSDHRDTLDAVLQLHLDNFQAGEISSADYEFAINLWLDHYCLKSSVSSERLAGSLAGELELIEVLDKWLK